MNIFFSFGLEQTHLIVGHGGAVEDQEVLSGVPSSIPLIKHMQTRLLKDL